MTTKQVNKSYLVWFKDGSAMIVDAPNGRKAIEEAERISKTDPRNRGICHEAGSAESL